MIFDTFLDADGGSPSLKTNSSNKISTLLSDHDLCDIPLIQRRLDYFFYIE